MLKIIVLQCYQRDSHMKDYKFQSQYLDIPTFASNKISRNQRIKTDFQAYSQKEANQFRQLIKLKKNTQKNQNIANSYVSDTQRNIQFPRIRKQIKKPIQKFTQSDKYLKVSKGNQKQHLPKSLNLLKFQSSGKQRKLSSRHNNYENTSYVSSQPQSQNKTQSDFLQVLIKKIKKTVPYEEKQDEYINKQKSQLVKLVKTLNKRLNQELKRCEKQNQMRIQSVTQSQIDQRKKYLKTQIQEDVPIRNQSRSQFKKSLVQIAEESGINQQLIGNMQNQLNFLNRKYEKFQKSLRNYTTVQNQIQQLKKQIKNKKQQISRIRKNKFLNQKAIVSIERRNGNLFSVGNDVSSTNCSVLSDSKTLLVCLKEQYNELMKKKQKIQTKIQLDKMHLNKIQQLKDKHNVNKQYYAELVYQMKRLNIYQGPKQSDKPIQFSNQKKAPKQTNVKAVTQNQHIDFMYKAKKSKLQILMKTIKRSQQSLKRKYYSLLKQYQSLVNDQNEQSQAKDKYLLVSKVTSQQTKNIQQKIVKSQNLSSALQSKIQRMKKVGKIVKRKNQVHTQNDQDNYDQDWNDQKDVTEQDNYIFGDDESSFLKENGSSQENIYFKSDQLVSRKNKSFQKLIQASPKSKTPSSQSNLKSHKKQKHSYSPQTPQKQQSEKDNFTLKDQNDKQSKEWYTSMQKQPQNTRRDERNIGKFKKQKIFAKTKINKVKQNPFSGQLEIEANQNQHKTDKQTNIINRTKDLKINYNSQYIIRQMIQGTDQFSSKHIQSRMQSQIQEQVEYLKQFCKHQKELNKQSKNKSVEKISKESYSQRQLQECMQQLNKEINTQQKQSQIKEKYSKILYTSNLSFF